MKVAREAVSNLNSFIFGGDNDAQAAVRDWAEKEIAALDSRDIPAEEKESEINRIENERDEKLKRLGDSQILWGKS